MIQKMKDKELVIRLADCYASINLLREYIMHNYWDVKMKIMSSFNHDDSYRF